MKRLDNILVNSGYGSRKDVQKIIKGKNVLVNNEIITKPSIHVNIQEDDITVYNEKVNYVEFVYLMMNKPKGFVSATHDKYDRTVLDLINDKDKFLEPYPIGRLDKDTVGLLIISNDGDMCHRVLAPKRHVSKKYFAKVNIPLNENHVKLFKNGIILEDNYKCMPGILNIISSSNEESHCEIVIHEGKFHQIKRMFESLGGSVTYLKRTNFGEIVLDESLLEGEYRHLTESEVSSLKSV